MPTVSITNTAAFRFLVDFFSTDDCCLTTPRGILWTRERTVTTKRRGQPDLYTWPWGQDQWEGGIVLRPDPKYVPLGQTTGRTANQGEALPAHQDTYTIAREPQHQGRRLTRYKGTSPSEPPGTTGYIRFESLRSLENLDRQSLTKHQDWIQTESLLHLTRFVITSAQSYFLSSLPT